MRKSQHKHREGRKMEGAVQRCRLYRKRKKREDPKKKQRKTQREKVRRRRSPREGGTPITLTFRERYPFSE